MAYQRAIADVYWRHRIWPKQRPDPKPALDAVMSQAQLEKKVADYMRNSQALEDYWQRPITAKQLQAEMERMAHHTKQPEVLRELFEALGNDSFVIAECLARPALTERLVADLSAQNRANHAESAIATTLASAPYTLPKISGGDPPCADDTWTATSITNAPFARCCHTAVWTGSEMIVWGGFYPPVSYWDDGGRYNPTIDSWAGTSDTNPPSGRDGHTAIWTGSEMIVWGGENYFGSLNTGGRYNPNTDSWTATSTGNAPSARYGHTAVWTGSEMIVWGGYNGNVLNTGGRYNPGTDSWTATSITNVPDARYIHTGVWTGSEMIVWGGYGGFLNWFNTGGRYNPSTDSWTATSTTNAPIARDSHTAVWTGSEMIIWGGYYGSELNIEGRYDAESAAPAPTATATPTPSATASPTPNIGTGGRYNPDTDSWTATSTTNAPIARDGYTAVWSGSEMIVWGGYGGSYLNTGGRYCAQSSATPTATPTATATPTLTPTPTPNSTPRGTPIPRPRPSPAPRP